MKKALYAIAKLLALSIFTPLVSASSVSTRINVSNATAHVWQSADNDTFEIGIENGTAVISANTTGEGTNFSVNATGESKLETNIAGNYDLNLTVDERLEKHSETGMLSMAYEFFHNILLSGWAMLNSVFGGILKINIS